jgi:hypothetical protein
MIALLGRYSRDVWELTFSGPGRAVACVVCRVRRSPRRIRKGTHRWLPADNEQLAIEIARLSSSAVRIRYSGPGGYDGGRSR